jgi:hypothetical protein
MKVWVLERGEYSDRSIVGAFSSEEKLRAYLEVYDREEKNHSITECELDSELPCDERRAGKHPYRVRIQGVRKDTRVMKDDAQAHALEQDFDPANETIRAESGWGQSDPFGILTTYCWARDEAHAIKIASERRAVYVAGMRVERDGDHAKCGTCGAECHPPTRPDNPSRPHDIEQVMRRYREALSFFIEDHATCRGGKRP